ncbi:uncharacterized protein NECHADRAFT_39507 [Fusarium vanettenii 77-13-4]|uniref:EKC/KEOPS complex subunit BUD32 n=1 Tax=Fusarium vanettenii (strain ATCC MYA-4622 / CBS 123669 / FGSC 9596 / NRRL 45880 / 77-13-4) TaxID=660122 RepID=C7Z818_FUSV7|nr:uncharacterized protein NECHADRAFT_39507 [Fusarium vanettenii 77-13-4]EEU39923.1 hypothetical protein NECHADRAFT_39507 [Fusarium vanettenii 77-13-4]
MIDEDSKYFSLSGDVRIGGPSTWHITDWDQRRVISVTMDDEQDDESIAIQHLRRHSSKLPPSVYRIHVSNTGEIITAYTDAENDETCCVHYPRLEEISLPEGVRTIRRDRLEELERLGPDTDLVTYPPCSSEPVNKVVFKYYFLWQYAQKSWKEMNLWMRLPCHPNIVPFDRVVLDELEGRVVGFTNRYVSGGTLEEDKSRIFRLKWLQQLIQVVDDLNLRYGISHQDIAPRNLVVDEPSDSIMLLDFNFAARINRPATEDGEGEWHDENRNDVKGVIFTIYEIITRDNSFRDAPHEEQSIDSLPLEWVKHQEVQLDRPIVEYRQALQEWRDRRALDPGSRDVPKAINWPPRPKPPKVSIPMADVHGSPCSITMDQWYERRQAIIRRGGKVLNWERPPQKVLDDGRRLLSTGKVIDC